MSSSRLVYTTRTGNPNHAELLAAVARIHTARRHLELACTTTTPEPHQRGEFPMTCGACHMVADA